MAGVSQKIKQKQVGYNPRRYENQKDLYQALL